MENTPYSGGCGMNLTNASLEIEAQIRIKIHNELMYQRMEEVSHNLHFEINRAITRSMVSNFHNTRHSINSYSRNAMLK